MNRLTKRLFADVAHTVLVLDPAGDRIRYANRSGCRLLGYELSELLATPISSVYREQASELERFLTRVIEYGHGWTKSLTLRTSRGASIPAEIFAPSRSCITPPASSRAATPTWISAPRSRAQSSR